MALSNQDQVALDENGFLMDPHQWSADVGESIAESLGLEGLGFARIQVIEYLHEHYLAHGSVPPADEVCHATRLEEHCIRAVDNGDAFLHRGGESERWRTS